MACFERNEEQDINCLSDTFTDMERMISDIRREGTSEENSGASLPVRPDTQGPLAKEDVHGQEDANSRSMRYVQKDGESTKLFKSVFYARNQFEKEEVQEPIPGKGGPGKPLFRMLTRYREAQEMLQDGYIQVPNIKIASFGGVGMPKVTQGDKDYTISKFGTTYPRYFYRISINHFIRNFFNFFQ